MQFLNRHAHAARPAHEADGRVEIKVATNNAKYSPDQDARQLVESQSELCYFFRWPEWPGALGERCILIVAAARKGTIRLSALIIYPFSCSQLLVPGRLMLNIESVAKCCAIDIDVQ